MKKLFKLFLLFVLILPFSVYAQRGCCSHHGGVSGCSSSGRQICNDGTISSSCTCTATINYVYGCTDQTANNYNSNANKDDGNCTYDVYGCTDQTANNYNSNANKDDGNCTYDVYGCTDQTANNYNINANKDDGSCKYEKNSKAVTNKKTNTKENNSSDNAVGGILTIGIIALIVWTVKNKKHK